MAVFAKVQHFNIWLTLLPFFFLIRAHSCTVHVAAHSCTGTFPAFSLIAAPLVKLTKQGINIKDEWGAAQDEAFRKLKLAIRVDLCVCVRV